MASEIMVGGGGGDGYIPLGLAFKGSTRTSVLSWEFQCYDFLLLSLLLASRTGDLCSRFDKCLVNGP